MMHDPSISTTILRTNKNLDGNVYLFMDTRVGGKPVAIHYGTADPDGVGAIKWHPTEDAVKFADIKPLIRAR